MVKEKYIPERGDIIWLTFSPTQGHEQSGRRPALVLSPISYNKLTGLAVVVPVTKVKKGFNFEIPIVTSKNIGVILSDHVHSLAYEKRGAEYIERASQFVVEEVCNNIKSLIQVV